MTDVLATKVEQLGNETVRLRMGVMAILERTRETPHIVMNNGQTMHDFCRALLVGPTLPPQGQESESTPRRTK